MNPTITEMLKSDSGLLENTRVAILKEMFKKSAEIYEERMLSYSNTHMSSEANDMARLCIDIHVALKNSAKNTPTA